MPIYWAKKILRYLFKFSQLGVWSSVGSEDPFLTESFNIVSVSDTPSERRMHVAFACFM